MRLSKRGEYGLRAMIYIAGASQSHQAENGMVQTRDIAEKENIPRNTWSRSYSPLKMLDCCTARWVWVVDINLGKPASEINLGQVFRILDGPVAPIRCVSQMAYEPCGCPDEATCGLRLTMLDVRNAIANILDRTSLADVIERVEAVKSISL